MGLDTFFANVGVGDCISLRRGNKKRRRKSVAPLTKSNPRPDPGHHRRQSLRDCRRPVLDAHRRLVRRYVLHDGEDDRRHPGRHDAGEAPRLPELPKERHRHD